MQNAEHALKRGETLATNWHLAIKQNVAAVAQSLHNGWFVGRLIGVRGAHTAHSPYPVVRCL